MCRIDDGDTPAVSRSKVSRARKPHRCGECGREIAIGESYRYGFLVDMGEAMSFHTCAHCGVACQWLGHNCGGSVYEQVLEEIVEHAEEYPGHAEHLRPLIDGMRGKWMNGGGLLPLPSLPAALDIHA